VAVPTNLNKEEINMDQLIYQQDCEFYRYQDRLRYSRFQTLATVEGATLLAFLTLNLSETIKWLIMLFGFVLVLLLCLLSKKDEHDAGAHLDRMIQFERKDGVTLTWNPPKGVLGMKGRHMNTAILILLNVFNLLFIIFNLVS
jgi:hypothetical protein